MFTKIAVASSLIAVAAAQSGAYGQCGGQGWAGSTTCISGYTCTYNSQYYSQCLPCSGSSCTSSGGGGGSSSGGGGTPTTTTSAPGATATLRPGNLWIRAVEDPNFHHYLQSTIPQTAGTAVFGDYTTAGQFQLTNGQVEMQLDSGGILYLTVQTATSPNATYLGTTFTTTPNTWGTWSFSGDGLNWVASNVTRSNTGAFLACGTGTAPSVNVNLGAYDYMTPAGCADETLNYYNASVTND